MRISVVHSTIYRYSAAVYLEPHIIRLRPRENASQRLIAFALDVAPTPAGRSESLDQDGNAVTHVWFDAPTAELAIHTSFQLDTLRENPFDYLLHPNDRHTPVQYEAALRGALVPYLRAGRDPTVRELARQVAVSVEWRTLPFLSALNQKLFDTTRQITRRDGAPLPPAQTLAAGEGSCRDIAALFCAACRSLGIAARFVSGYERGAALADDGDLHAWAEVYLQGGGWRGYDPSRGLSVADSHVAVAASSESSLAAPVSGTFRGSARSDIEYSIAMQVSEEGSASERHVSASEWGRR